MGSATAKVKESSFHAGVSLSSELQEKSVLNASRFSKYFLLFRADGLILFGAGGGQNSPIRGQSGLFPKAGRGTNQKGAQEGPEGELKQEEPEQVMAGTEGRRNRKKSDAGGVGAGKAMWPEERPCGERTRRPGKATRRGRSREGDVAGKGRGKARAGKGKMPGLEEELCGGQRPEKRRLHTASGAEPPSGKFRSAG